MAADTHAFAEVRCGSEHRSLPAQAGLAQALAQVLVEIKKAGLVTQAFAVRRVADDQPFLVLVWARLETPDVTLVDTNPARQSGALDVVATRLDQTRIGFVATNPQRWSGQTGLRARLGVGVQAIPQRRHMPQPGAEAPAFALEIGCDIGRHHRAFHQEGTHTAHGVGQRTTSGGDARPAGADQDGGGKVFLQWCSTLLQTIAALMQAMTGQVQREHGLPLVQAQVHPQVGVELIDAWPLARCAAQPVDDGILDLERTEMRVVDPRTTPAELHGQAAGWQQVLGPIDGVHALVERLGIDRREATDHQQYAVGQA